MNTIEHFFTKVKYRLICFSLIISCFFFTVFPLQASNLSPHSKTLVTAHRGYHHYVPENTIPAIKQAIAIHADYAELDVQQTKDGVLVVCHDNNLKCLTGHDVNIKDLNYSDLVNYPLLSSSGIKIPSLSDVLKTAKGHIKLNIEVKYAEHEQNIIPKVISLITSYHMENSCFISSFYRPFLTQVKAINPTIRTAYTLDFVPKNITHEDVDIISMAFNCVDPILVNQIHNSGKELHVWTVNKDTDISKMLNLHVDNIITDNPVLALAKVSPTPLRH